MGDVTKVVTATGTVQSSSTANLTFGAAGRLASLKVKVGDPVQKGEVLAELDKNQLQVQVTSASANLKSAEAKLASLQQGATSADLAQLESQVTRAQADLDTAKRNLEIAQQNADSTYLQKQVQDAATRLTAAQNNYDAANKTGNAAQTAMAKAQLDQANKDYAAAIAAQSNISQAQTQLASAQNAVRSAQAAYDSAVAQLNSKKQPATQADLAQAQAAVEQARAALATAENNLAQATLTAPFDGIVTAVNLHEGEQVGGNTTVLSLQATGSALQVVVPVDEADIAVIKLGQKATVTADSLPGEKFEATVDQIAPAGVTQNNVTTFPVTLTLTGDTSHLKVGQSMTANIEIDKRTNVLTVPSEAIRGLGNRKSVMVYNGEGQDPVSTTVEVGLDDGTNAEILNGLQVGQKVVLGIRSSSNQQRQSNNTNPFGGPRVGGGLGGGGNFGGGGNRGNR